MCPLTEWNRCLDSAAGAGHGRRDLAPETVDGRLDEPSRYESGPRTEPLPSSAGSKTAELRAMSR